MEPSEMYKLLNNIPVESENSTKKSTILPWIVLGLTLSVVGFYLYKTQQIKEVNNEVENEEN